MTPKTPRTGSARYRSMTPAQRNAALAAKRKAAANRLKAVGQGVAMAVERGYDHATVTLGETTSNAPLIRVAFPDGEVFHVTVTRART